MPLAPEIQALVDAMAANPDAKPTHELTPEDAREGYRTLGAMFGPGEAIASVADRSIPGPAGQIPLRCYRPASETPLPVVVFYHGGGWTIGDLDTHDKECRAIANRAGAVVVSVDYRLGPENRYPAATEDAYAALCWLGKHADEIGGNCGKIAVVGDSAGGNLAAVVALRAREENGPTLCAQVLVYPAVDLRPEAASLYPSRQENAAGPFLLDETMTYFTGHYLEDEAKQGMEVHASPLLATSHAALPPALVVTAECDPLRDEGAAYADALDAAGVPVTRHLYEGMPHAFFQLSPIVPAGKALLEEIGEYLRGTFAA